MTYDSEGRFRPQQFEDIFNKHDRGHKGGLTFGDLIGFWKGQAMVFDFFGISACIFECKCHITKLSLNPESQTSFPFTLLIETIRLMWS